jgi:hypothetical protein
MSIDIFSLPRVTLEIIVIDTDGEGEPQPCSKCARCEKEFEENPNNPYGLILPFPAFPGKERDGCLDLMKITALCNGADKKFEEDQYQDSSVFFGDMLEKGVIDMKKYDNGYPISFSCSSAGCEIGFVLEGTLNITYNNIGWLL